MYNVANYTEILGFKYVNLIVYCCNIFMFGYSVPVPCQCSLKPSEAAQTTRLPPRRLKL